MSKAWCCTVRQAVTHAMGFHPWIRASMRHLSVDSVAGRGLPGNKAEGYNGSMAQQVTSCSARSALTSIVLNWAIPPRNGVTGATTRMRNREAVPSAVGIG